MIRVAVSGTGQMGTLVRETVEAQADMEFVGAHEPLRGGPLADLLALTRPDVVVDFTNAAFTGELVDGALAAGIRLVIGTSGPPADAIERLRSGCEERGLGSVVAANFALGAVVLIHAATIAARYFEAAEIIELHHDKKVDAPSGTALDTARRMRAARGRDFEYPEPELTHIPGTRGGVEGGVGIHSVRLPGFVAHQEVIFGGTGQTLSLRHDSTGRDSFMPGVLLAIREVMQRDRLVEGLDVLIGLREA